MNPILDPKEVKYITIEPDPPPDGPYCAKWTTDVVREQIRRMEEAARDPGRYMFDDMQVSVGTLLRLLKRELQNPSIWEICVMLNSEKSYGIVRVSLFRWDAPSPVYMLGYNEAWQEHHSPGPIIDAIEAALARARVEGGR